MAHKNKTNLSPYRKSTNQIATPGARHRKPVENFDLNQVNDRLFDLFKNHDLSWVSHRERLLLAQFFILLMENQKVHNMTRLVTLRDVAIKHFVDCLHIVRLTKFQFPLMDVGTGPGFPGIPLKIHFPLERILLAEGVQKRVEFLKTVRQELNLKQLDIIGRNINPYFAYPVQGVITRAVEDVRNTLTNVSTCLQTGGRVYLMKGPLVDPEIEIALRELGEYYSLESDFKYDLPNSSHHRRLLVFQKIKPGPEIDFDEEPWPDDDDL